VIAIASVLVSLRAFVAERLPELTETQIDAAEQLWQRNGPVNYDMDLELRGARPGQVHVEVRNSEVTALTRDGRTPPQRTWNVWSVPGLFETLARELELAGDPEHEMNAVPGTQVRLRCAFDPQYGYPANYHRYVSAGGPEVYWEVKRFASR
jgi:hypothetical protein